ncbi:MAG TPA: 5-formyltetrahydrofolate cyclo-ligase [Methylomirabilota bacterium]|nr:5-formyltetrahydrofolate cyclo-ligase [Methylomirabilota bacterium]
MSVLSIQEQKKTLRAQARQKIKAIAGPIRAQASTHACNLLLAHELWSRADVVLMYWPLAGELDLRSAIAAGLQSEKTILLPRFDPVEGTYVGCVFQGGADELQAGEFGVPEPALTARTVPYGRVDLALVPGLAFDWAGGRLGRGRGFYDRILAQVAGVKCGVAFEEQIEPELPIEAHDALLDYLLTPVKFIKTKRANADRS